MNQEHKQTLNILAQATTKTDLVQTLQQLNTNPQREHLDLILQNILSNKDYCLVVAACKVAQDPQHYGFSNTGFNY